MQAEGSYGDRIMAVGRISGYRGAGVERKEAAGGILCLPACVNVSIGVRGIEGPPVSFSAQISQCPSILQSHFCPSQCLPPWLWLTWMAERFGLIFLKGIVGPSLPACLIIALND